MNYRHLRFAIVLASCVGVAMLDCKGSGRAPTLPDEDPQPMGGNGGRGGSASTNGGTQNGGSSGSDVDPGSEDAGVDAAGANCGAATCRGAGKCVDVDGEPECVCDFGYTLLGIDCVVDENCIQLRRLEHGCRLRDEAEPAVGMFFMLETCAGTTVRPEILGDVSQAFKVKENNLDLGAESYATVFDREVESLVMVALDLSQTVASNPDTVVPLIGEIRNFVNAIEPEPGEPNVSVGLIVFGRSVHVLREITSDFAQIRADLDALQANPEGAVAEPAGTNLYGAVETGIDRLEVYMAANYEFGDLGSVLKVGTLVTVTDGQDTSGGTLSTAATVVNRISIGINAEIDDVELSRVGPHGSFLAPQPADWTQAFQRVAERVDEYRQRAYLLTYCSPAVEGTHQVAVTLANQPAQADARCSFNATTFGVGVGSCNADFVNNYCDTRACGSFLACRSCSADGGIPTQAVDDQWRFGPAN